MSIETRLNAINDHLVDDYSVLTLAGADLTNVNKNIVNLKPTWKERLLYFMNNGTDTVWNNWDKVNGSGTSITLNNTEYAPMQLEYGGNTSQDSTTGKNLFNINGTKTNVACTSSVSNNELTQTNSGTYSRTLWTIDNLTIGKNYTLSLSYNNSSASTIGIMIRNSGDTTTIANTTSTTNTSGTETLTFTATETTHKIRLYSNQTNTSNTSVVIFSNIQLESGSSATSYEPYTNGASPNPDYPQEVHVVSGDNTIKVEGKNLLGLTDGTYSHNQITATVSNGKITLNGTASGTSFVQIPLLSNINLTNQTVTISLNNATIGGDNATEVRIYTNGTNYMPCTFLAKNATVVYQNRSSTYVRVQIRTSSGVSYDNFVIYPMLEYGNQASTYETYTGQSYPISLGNTELCKIGTYQDLIFKNIPSSTHYDNTLDEGDWYLKKEIGKVVLNGSETWATSNNQVGTSSFYRYSCNDFQDTTIYMANTPYMSDNFKYSSNTLIEQNVIGNTSTANTNRLWITIDTTLLNGTTTSDFKTWLSTHNTEVYYVLATPTYTTITDTTLKGQLEAIKRSYENQTNISQTNNDLPFELSVSALEEMS